MKKGKRTSRRLYYVVSGSAWEINHQAIKANCHKEGDIYFITKIFRFDHSRYNFYVKLHK